MNPASVDKILILRLSSIGDILLTFPLIKALRTRFPNAEIDYVVKKQYAELVSANPHIGGIITFDKNDGWEGLREIKRTIRVKGFDLIIDIHRNIRSWYLRKWIMGPKVLKYRKYLIRRWLLVLTKINLFKEPVSLIERYLDTVKKLGIESKKPNLEIYIPPQAYSRVKDIFKKQIHAGITRIAAFCPGAGFATKRWPVQGFCQVGNNLMNKGNTQIVVLGGAEDAALGEYIRSHVSGPVFNACGLFSILESAAIMSHCQIVLANDTGLLHVATALNKPTVAIFGPTTLEMGYFPDSPEVSVIEKNIECRPCSHNGSNQCPEGHFLCMNSITGQEVWQTLETYMRNEQYSPPFAM